MQGIDERAEAERVGEEDELLAMLCAFLAHGREELDAFEPFFGSEIDFAGEGVQVADFDASVAGLGLGKKGVPLRASRPWACWSRLGWLPLIWRRKSPPFSTMTRAVLRWQCKGSAVMILPSRAGSFSSSHDAVPR